MQAYFLKLNLAPQKSYKSFYLSCFSYVYLYILCMAFKSMNTYFGRIWSLFKTPFRHLHLSYKLVHYEPVGYLAIPLCCVLPKQIEEFLFICHSMTYLSFPHPLFFLEVILETQCTHNICKVNKMWWCNK